MHRNKDYPNPKSQGAKQKMSVPSVEDTTRSEVVKAGECIKDSDGKVVGQESKVKAAYGQTKGLLWYNYIK
ncbi:hypothetical protein [Marinobacter sp.]|jgi:hypothetical protein|uniref:hypothetical protein n=1 Tax=Marinobacter sp. TaxID=50741 RepID=UPI00235707F7|nr:hypothetical protein [Marinobacter sp.]|tara:strand:+ start:6284 stop:6496 length:213 start_codon:yes stop_codon:yes gene_type:complete